MPPCSRPCFGRFQLSGPLGSGLIPPRAPRHPPARSRPALGTCPGTVCVSLSCRRSSSTSPIVQKGNTTSKSPCCGEQSAYFNRALAGASTVVLVVVPSPLILCLKASHAADQVLSPVAWGADRRGSRHKCVSLHPGAVGLCTAWFCPGTRCQGSGLLGPSGGNMF